MWVYEKTLQYPVNLKCRDLRMAKVIMTQLGGPNGELAAALRYLQQRYTMPTGKSKGLLTDIGTEERAQKRYRYFFLPIIMWNYTLSYILFTGIVCCNPTTWNLDPDVTTDFSNVLAGYTRAFLECAVAVSMFSGIDCQLLT